MFDWNLSCLIHRSEISTLANPVESLDKVMAPFFAALHCTLYAVYLNFILLFLCQRLAVLTCRLFTSGKVKTGDQNPGKDGKLVQRNSVCLCWETERDVLLKGVRQLTYTDQNTNTT